MGPNFKGWKNLFLIISALVLAMGGLILYYISLPSSITHSEISIQEDDQRTAETLPKLRPNSTGENRAASNTANKKKYQKSLAEKHFEDEVRDSSWADTAEATLYSLFYELESLSDYSVSKVECRSEQCYLEVYTHNMSPPHQLVLTLRSELMSGEIASGSITLLIAEDDFIRLLVGRDEVTSDLLRGF